MAAPSKFQIIFLFLIVLLSGTSIAHSSRDVAPILDALKTFNDDLSNCTQSCKNYNGSFSSSVSLSNCCKKLNDDLKSATTASNNNAVATDSEAQTIIDYINGTLEPNVKAWCQCLVDKKAVVQQAGGQNGVKECLNNVKNGSSTLMDSVIAKCPSSKKSAAQSAKTKIINDLQQCINAYSS